MPERKRIILSEEQKMFILMESMSVDEIYSKYYSDIPLDVYKTIVTKADPTYNPQKPDKMGIYTKWLLGMVRKGTFKTGDIKEAYQLLGVFDKYKNKLEEKDVTRLHSMAELYMLVQPYMNSNAAASKGEEKRRVKEEEGEVWYEDNNWLVIIPHSEEAAKLYGKGTKWCTAAEKDNMFNFYDEQGSLYILIRKSDGAKFQFHFETEQFMDAQDESLKTPIARTIGLPDRLVNDFFGYYDDESNYTSPFYLVYDEFFGLENNYVCVVLDGKYNILDYYDDVYLFDEWISVPGDVDCFNVHNLSYDNSTMVVLDTSMGIKILDIETKTFFPEGDKYLQAPSAHGVLGLNEWGRYSLDDKWFMMTTDRFNGLKRWPENFYLDVVSKPSYDGWYVVQKGEKYALFCGRGFAKNGTVLPSDNINEWLDAVYDTHDRLLPGNFDKQSVYASFTCFDQAGLVKVMKDGIEYYMNGNGKMDRINEEIEESKTNKNKTVILSEEQKDYILAESGEEGSPLIGKKEGSPFYVDPEKVKVVKKYLDSGFVKGSFEDMDDNGYPTKVSVVAMLDGNGDVIRNLTDVQLFYLLQDRFKNITANKQHRDSFLKQVIKDWFYDKIKPSGLLSVNMLNEAQEWNLILEAMSVGDIYQKYYSDIPEDVYKTVVTQADPTYNPQKPDKMGIYTKWLLGMVRKGTFKPGDATEARNLLAVFGKFKNKIEVKDVTQLHSMKELYDVVKPYMGQQTTGEKNREAKSGAEKVYEDGEWLIITPHTEEAAKLYGKGTKWCTAADNDNMFDYYNDNGPLYIIIYKVNPSEKYQFHFETNQYRDAEDEEIDIDAFCEEDPGIKDFVSKQMEEKERRFQEKVDNALNRLKNGENPKDVFYRVGGFHEGFVDVRLNGKWNFLTREGEFLSEKWFDWVGDFHEGFAEVRLNGKRNFINREGKVVSRKWFDWLGDFYDGFVGVGLNDKYNFINRNGELLSQQWFNDVWSFRDGFAAVELNDRYNFINREGNYLSRVWFDKVGNFHKGFAEVKLNGKLMYLDRNGKLWDEKPAIQEGMPPRQV